jgi:hypothetical protein
MTASTPGSEMRSCPVSCTYAPGSRATADFARSRSTSVTAVTRAPDNTSVSLRMWSCPIIPAPMTPTFTVP